MVIITKFKYQDTVWFMNNNTVFNGRVIKVYTFSQFDNPTRIMYKIQFLAQFVKLIESRLFATKEELINSL
jgi:hypothetical protein